MGYHRMTDAEIRAFLVREPARPAILGTTRADGRAHVAPIWYLVDEERHRVILKLAGTGHPRATD